MRGSRATAFLYFCLAVGTSQFSAAQTLRTDLESPAYGAAHGGECPEDSVRDERAGCKCAQAKCPTAVCRPGQRPVQVRPADPETPGSCCPRYECVPSESVSWARLSTDETEMTGCIHNDTVRKIGERWRETDCVSCVCQKDGVSCHGPMCMSCENAIPPDPGECCPHCPPLARNVSRGEPSSPRCRSLEDCELRCEHGYANDQDDCPTCECADPEKDGTPVDPVRSEDDKICPELPHCGLNCDLVKDEGGCSVCACQPSSSRTAGSSTNGTVRVDGTGKKVICPEVKCDLHCERGLVMDENDCTFCECKAANAGCPALVGCRKRCPFGYKTNKRGCPICRCRASCADHLNETHPEGSTWYPNACTSCACEPGGRLSCKETICSVACSNPLPPKPGSCCPVCPITGAKENETTSGHQGARGWGTVPIMLIAILALLCLLLIVHIVRSRFRGRLSPSEAAYSSYPPQYYKCVPAYDTPVHRNEKIVPL